MPSFDAINYSLRPSKSIQRQIVFDGLRLLQQAMGNDNSVYIGFGSIWFADFTMAHKLLGISDMISIEGNDIGYRRAVFNAPFATVRVFEGFSYDILPELLADPLASNRPWIVWLDFDYELNESVQGDIRFVIENAPANSVLIVTMNGLEYKLGTPNQRPSRLRAILGSVVPDGLTKDQCKDDQFQETLADLVLNYMTSSALDLARPGGFTPAFRAIYKDGAPMVTVGGVLPTLATSPAVSATVNAANWPARPAFPIRAPHLTIREAASLQACLPSTQPLTRAMVQQLGFDLEDEQIEAFQSYYRQYPAYAQIIA